MKKSSILLILILLGMVSTATATSTDGYIATITIDGSKNVTFADHTDSTMDGNWIYLSGGTSMDLPSPISFTYNGINETTYTYNDITIDVNLNVDEYSDHVISYPYTQHPMYTDVTGQNDVNMAFRGSTYFAEQTVDVYLLSPSRASLTGVFNEVTKGNTTPINELIDGAYKKYLNHSLDTNGDMVLNFGTLGAGDYAVLVLLNDTYLEGYDDISILSATAFEILEYNSTLEAPSSVEPNKDIDVNITLIDAPDSSYTYGAVLIHEDAYRADMVLNCNGTKEGLNLTLNDELLVEGFGLVGLNIYDLNQNDMINLVTNLMEEDGTMYGTLVVESSNTNQERLSLTTLDLPEGNYILLVGVYEPGNYLVAFQQDIVTIANDTEESSSSSSSNDGSRSVNGGGTSGEPYENIELRDVATNFVSKDSVVTFTFSNPDSDIQYVSYRALTNAGYTIASIEQLKGTSTYVKESAENMVYKNVNIWIVYKNINVLVGRPGYASEDYIDDAVIGFKVDKTWVEDNNVEISSIRMKHYHGDVWNPLSTTLIDEDEQYLYFVSTTPGFSPFAITGEQKATSAGEDVTGTDTDATQPGIETQESDGSPLTKYTGGFVALLVIGGAMVAYIRTRRYQ